MLVQIYEAGTNEMVMADVTVNADNSIVIKINQTDSSVTSLAAGTYKGCCHRLKLKKILLRKSAAEG